MNTVNSNSTNTNTASTTRLVTTICWDCVHRGVCKYKEQVDRMMEKVGDLGCPLTYTVQCTEKKNTYPTITYTGDTPKVTPEWTTVTCGPADTKYTTANN